MTETPLVTVAILTYNGETYLERILDAVLQQRVDGEVEVLVVDSGSTDRTLDIVRARPSVRLHEIPNAEFGHGRTRNLAAQLATGEYIAYLTHDAVPTDDQWLDQLLKPFGLNDRIVAVLGRQVPRDTSFPLQKFEISGLFGALGSVGATTLYLDDPTIPTKNGYQVTFYSDVNSATRRSFLLDTIPYRDVPYAEDQLFGKDLIDAGYIKAYAPRASVEHSNDLTLHEYSKRIFDETVGLRRIGFAIEQVSVRHAVLLAGFGILGDTYRIFRDKDYTVPAKLRWLFVNPAFQIAKWRSYRRSCAVDLGDHAAIRAGSLEHHRKRRR